MSQEYEWAAVLSYHMEFHWRRRHEMTNGDYSQWAALTWSFKLTSWSARLAPFREGASPYEAQHGSSLADISKETCVLFQSGFGGCVGLTCQGDTSTSALAVAAPNMAPQLPPAHSPPIESRLGELSNPHVIPHLPTVLCHHSPRWIFLTFRQDSLYSRCQPLPIYAAPPSANSGILCFRPRHSFHPLTSGRICFCPSRATHGSHPRLIHIGSHLSSLRIKRGGLTLQFLSFLKEAMECDGKMRQWRFSMETRCHSETIRCHWRKLYLRCDSAQFNVSSFLDLYARI